MIVKVKDDWKSFFPQFYLSGELLNVCNMTKNLGYFCTDDITHGKDITKHCRKLYTQGNTLFNKFHMHPEVN